MLTAIVALAVAVALLIALGYVGTRTMEATTIGPGTMSFRVKGGAVDCAPTAKPLKCTVPVGGGFTLAVAVNNFPTGDYIAVQTDIDWTGSGLTYKPTMPLPDPEFVWPDSAFPARAIVSPTHVLHGAVSSGLPNVPGTYKGNVVAIAMNCTTAASSNVITLVPYDPISNPVGAVIADPAFTPIPQADSITINCVSPRMQKLPALQNLFLTRQGVKIPPLRCVDGTDAGILTESISVPITSADPKALSQPQQLGGFSFQVKYDPLKVCVALRPGPAWSVNPQQVCTVQDSVTAPTLQGIARINCVTLGKATRVDTSTAAGRTLAIIEVRPQPGAYSQIRANQDNGQVAQLNSEQCKLTDLQGHAIQVFSCEDADVTIRFLEGDVEPDCQVNTLDTQAIAFRWGAFKGSTIYNERFNLEPSGTQADQDIDVNDLQFVYGRFGSTCALPHPPQAPVKAK